MVKNIFLPFIFILLSSFFIFSQEKLKDGYQQFYFSNGQVSSEGLIKNGLPEGYWISYYPTGIIKSEGNRKKSLLDSTWIFYSELGNLQSKINYKKGKKNGLKISYSDSCNVILIENYENDIKQGFEKHFYDVKGEKIWKEIPYIDNVRDGKGFEYAQDDERIISMILFKKGTLIGKERINRKNRNEQKNGIWKEFYDNGSLKKESKYKNGLLNGYVKEFDKNGMLIKATLYINGVAQTYAEEIATLDIKKEFYSDGTLKKEGIYDVTGKENGLFKYFDKKGQIEKTEIYVHGVLIAIGLIDKEGRRQGYWEEYYFEPEGQLKSKGKYKDGKKIEKWEYFFTNNQLQQIGKYDKKGRPTGLWKWYHKNSQLLREENFRKGLEDGMMYEYLDDGSIITQGEYIDGKKEGSWLYQLGDHKEEGSYRDDVKHGIWKYHYITTDELNFQGNFIDGEPDGKHKYYYENGKIKREEIYEMGRKTGIWKHFNKFGELTISLYYKNDEIVKIDGKKVKQ